MKIKTTGEWYNIVATYDGSTNYYLYVNGVVRKYRRNRRYRYFYF